MDDWIRSESVVLAWDVHDSGMLLGLILGSWLGGCAAVAVAPRAPSLSAAMAGVADLRGSGSREDQAGEDGRQQRARDQVPAGLLK